MLSFFSASLDLFFMMCSVLSLNIGGLVFVKPMRERNCMTMLDPFHLKYGKAITTALSLVSLFLDVIWVPTTLTGLGTVYQYPFSFTAHQILMIGHAPLTWYTGIRQKGTGV